MGGRVMDPETSFDAVRNVEIKERKIVTITEKGMGCKPVVDTNTMSEIKTQTIYRRILQ